MNCVIAYLSSSFHNAGEFELDIGFAGLAREFFKFSTCCEKSSVIPNEDRALPVRVFGIFGLCGAAPALWVAAVYAGRYVALDRMCPAHLLSIWIQAQNVLC